MTRVLGIGTDATETKTELVKQPSGGRRGQFTFRSKERRIRLRHGAVSAAFSAAGAHLCSLFVPVPATSSQQSPAQSGVAFFKRDCRLRSAQFCRSLRLPTVRGAAAAGRAAQETLPAREAPNQFRWELSESQQNDGSGTRPQKRA